MPHRRFVSSLVLMLVAASCQSALAGRHGGDRGHRGDCGDFGRPCEITYQTVTSSIMVPTMVPETRTVNFVECRDEQREYHVTVFRQVPETRSVEYEYFVPTYEKRSREMSYTVCKPIMTTEQRQVTGMVPAAETRQGTRRVCSMVPVTRTRMVCEDHGSWQQVARTYKVGCGDCAETYTRMCKVWAPKYERREVQYTVMRPQIQEVPYQYTVTVCHAQTETREVQVCNFVRERQTRQVPYTVCIPQRHTGTREVTTCRILPEEVTRTCTVQVPHTAQRQVTIQVCRMVPKTITEQVPVCAPCDGYWDHSVPPRATRPARWDDEVEGPVYVVTPRLARRSQYLRRGQTDDEVEGPVWVVTPPDDNLRRPSWRSRR